jgi:SAM-dependent methyltransferase
MKRSDWDARYAEDGLVWGLEPNRFVKAELAELEPGHALDLACGEGRNAVWLAARGWRVTGIDFSDVAIDRARRLAAGRDVHVDFVVGDVLDTPIDAATFDLVLIAYLQLPPDERRTVLDRAVAATAPGGTFLLVAHDLRNLAEGHGGPKRADVLWTVDEATSRLTELGVVVERGDVVLRDVDGALRPAIDTLVRARRPDGDRATGPENPESD